MTALAGFWIGLIVGNVLTMLVLAFMQGDEDED